MNFNDRKEELKKLALDNYSNGGEIYRLINEGYLDHIIDKITDDKTFTNSTAIVKKGYLTGNEQFLDLIAEVLYYFEKYFIIVQHKEQHIANILENRVPNFLLCKKYWGDNNYIPYYKKNIIKLFVRNFYDNIKFMYDSYETFFEDLNITTTMSINNPSDLDILLKLLEDIIWCNFENNQHSFDYLFSNYKFRIKEMKPQLKDTKFNAENIVYRSYNMHWYILIEEYKKRIDTVKKFLHP